MNKLSIRIFTGVCAMALAFSVQAEDENYTNVADDLGNGLELQEVADRAHEWQ